MEHIEIARKIARKITGGNDLSAIVAPDGPGHQGDLVISARMSADESVTTSDGVTVVAEGAHGWHVIVGDHAAIQTDTGWTVHVGDGGAIIAHTDKPGCRHGAIILDRGRRDMWRQRELTADGIVQVAD